MKSSIVIEEVLSVLKYSRIGYATAYQILDRLSPPVRDELLKETESVAIIAQAAKLIDGIEVEYLDAKGLGLHVSGRTMTPGKEKIPIFRLATTDR